MFCINCGIQLPDEAKFCSNCGKVLVTPNTDQAYKMNNEPKTKFVSAKCTSCGANLEVDSKQSAAICTYCNSAYIVEQAINNYNIKMDGNVNVGSATINVNSISVDNLLMRARDFDLKNDFENAINYYNKVLDIDFKNQDAHEGIKNVKLEIENYIYFKINTNYGFSKGVLYLKKNKLVYFSNKGKEETYYLDQITKLDKKLGSVIQFDYPNKFGGVTFGFSFSDANEFFDILNSAIQGIYPDIKPFNHLDYL